MQIYGPSNVHGAQPINPPHSSKPAPAPGETPLAGGVQDELQISDVGRFIDQVREVPEIRADKVQQLRDALQDGSYDVDAKLDLALDSLLDELS